MLCLWVDETCCGLSRACQLISAERVKKRLEILSQTRMHETTGHKRLKQPYTREKEVLLYVIAKRETVCRKVDGIMDSDFITSM